MPPISLRFFLLNIGHFLDHFLTLVFATASALVLTHTFGLSYAELIRYATPGFMAFGLFAWPAGWLADHWSRDGMMCLFFLGMGISSLWAGAARSPFEIGCALTLMGVFAAIYHPVGLSLLVQDVEKKGRVIAINGVFGNLGVGGAALLTGFFIDHGGWRNAFLYPGFFSLLCGILYAYVYRQEIFNRNVTLKTPSVSPPPSIEMTEAALRRLTYILLGTISASGFIFQSVSFALPKILDERVNDLLPRASDVGWFIFVVFTIASLAQILAGFALDRFQTRKVFMCVALIQMVFLGLMPFLSGWIILPVTLGFICGIYGQAPITDYVIGNTTKPEQRARVYGVRYVLIFTVIGLTVPSLSLIHEYLGFQQLFYILAALAGLICVLVSFMPQWQRVSPSL